MTVFRAVVPWRTPLNSDGHVSDFTITTMAFRFMDGLHWSAYELRLRRTRAVFEFGLRAETRRRPSLATGQVLHSLGEGQRPFVAYRHAAGT